MWQLLPLCAHQFNCTDKCPDELPHKATDTTREQPETICIAEPLVYELVRSLLCIIIIVITVNIVNIAHRSQSRQLQW